MSDWIEHDGGVYPPLLQAGCEIAVRFRDNSEFRISESEAAGGRWSHIGRHDDIMAYRVVQAAPAASDEFHKAHARIEELERKVGTLIEENQALKERLAAPRMPRADGKPAWLEQVAAEEVTDA